MSTIYERQIDNTATAYLRASIYVGKQEKLFKLFAIFLLVGTSILGIFNNYMDFMTPTTIVLVSSGALVVSELLFMRTTTLGQRTATIMDIYESYIYGIAPNKMLTKKISPYIIENYSNKVRPRKRHMKYYFSTPQEASSKYVIFDNQFMQFVVQYKLLLFVRGFFFTLWSMFFIALIVLSAVYNDMFMYTLINIMIPSIGVVIYIIKSWAGIISDMTNHQITIGTLNKIKRNEDVNTALFIRSVQDLLYRYRSSSFNVPTSLEKLFLWKESRIIRRTTRADREQKKIHRTSSGFTTNRGSNREEARAAASSINVKKIHNTTLEKRKPKPGSATTPIKSGATPVKPSNTPAKTAAPSKTNVTPVRTATPVKPVTPSNTKPATGVASSSKPVPPRANAKK